MPQKDNYILHAEFDSAWNGEPYKATPNQVEYMSRVAMICMGIITNFYGYPKIEGVPTKIAYHPIDKNQVVVEFHAPEVFNNPHQEWDGVTSIDRFLRDVIKLKFPTDRIFVYTPNAEKPPVISCHTLTILPLLEDLISQFSGDAKDSILQEIKITEAFAIRCQGDNWRAISYNH